ncbi:MAG: DNA-processing protein DprA [Longimicrobiales bacterium]
MDGTLEALVLRALPGVGPKRFRSLVDEFGGARAALSATDQDFLAAAGSRAAAERTRKDVWKSAETLLSKCEGRGIEVWALGTPAYPDRLLDLTDPPPALFALGDTSLLSQSAVAVVGSRRASVYGRRVARQIGEFLVGQGRCVVSGMAMGIDAEAHLGALPGPTIAVLGSGVDRPTPHRNRGIYQRILESGLVLSSFDPGAPAEAHNFPARNRIIAALAEEIIVVEAAARSGALITAEFGLDLGREIHAVPGPIDRQTSAGTNRLIADGASMIVGVDSSAPFSRPLEELHIDPDLRGFLAHVPEVPESLDVVALTAGVPISEALVFATRLQLEGLMSTTRDGLVLRTPGGRTPAGRAKRSRS